MELIISIRLIFYYNTYKIYYTINALLHLSKFIDGQQGDINLFGLEIDFRR